MNVYAELPSLEMSKGLARVRDALKRHAPDGVVFVGERSEADLIVHHVVGVQNYDSVPIHERIGTDGKPYAMIQYCLKTTENGGSPGYWHPLWYHSRCVWSYYDLGDWAINDGQFYYAPLGVDPLFKLSRPGVPKLFTVGTSGFVAETEGVRECAQAVEEMHGSHFHLGPDFGLGQRTTSQSNLTDLQVARRWQECEYVAGLRRVEGFELPAAEGLCMGARPVLFDAPHYRQWFGDAGRYVPEGAPEDVVRHLRAVFERHEPVTLKEQAWAYQQFDWARLVPEFWKRVL